MSQRLSFAAAFAAACALALALALGSNAYSRANAHAAAPKGPAPAVTKFRAAAEKAEDAGYLKRLGGGKVEAKGWISLTHFDAKAGKAAPADHYVLNTDEGPYSLKVSKATKVKGSGAPASFAEGQVVQMTGAISDGTITVSQAQVTSTLPDPTLGPVPTTTQRSQRVLTILATFEDAIPAGQSTAPQPWTKGAVESAMGGTGDGLGARTVRNFFRQSSEGTYTLDATVTPWLKVSMTRGAACAQAADLEPWFDAAKDAAKNQANLDPANYDYVLLATTRGATDCQFGGVAFGSGRTIVFPYEPWENDPNFPMDRTTHELGHAVGLGHAGVANCREGATRVPISGDCDLAFALDQPLEYGDTSDVMGTSKVMGTTRDVRLFSAAHRAELGFIPLDRVIDAEPSDVLEHTIVRTKPDLDSSTAPQAGKQLIEVVRPKTSQGTNVGTNGINAWEIEYRDATEPFDNFPAGSPAVDRVTLRLSNPVRAAGGWNKTYAVSSAVTQRGAPIDANDPYTAGLTEGQSLYDPVEDFTISVIDITATDAKIKVTPGGPQDRPGMQVTKSGSQLFINAQPTDKRDGVSVVLYEGRYIVRNFGGAVEPGSGCVQETPTSVGCTSRNVRQINVFTHDQDDVVTISPSVSVATRIEGATGNDFLEGGRGADLFTSLSAVDGNDVIRGNSGRDTVSYADRTAGVTVTDTNGGNVSAGESDALTSVENADGSPHADILNLSSDTSHRIDGRDGADRITTGGADDLIVARDNLADVSIICGGGSNDRVIADDGTTDPVDASCEDKDNSAQPEITDGPAAGSIISDPQPQFTYATPVLGTATVQCAVVATTVAPTYGACTSATTHKPSAALASGTYDVWVRTRSASGTVLGTDSRTFTVDTTAPSTTIGDKPQNPSAVQNSTFTFSSPGAAAGFECSIDNGAFVTCRSPRTFSGLAEGTHTFSVRAYGAGGAVDPNPPSYQWTIDRTAPQTTISGTPAEGATVLMNGVNLTFTSSESPSTFVCSWTSTALAPCGASTQGPSLPGTYTLRVAAVDAAGNVDDTPATRTVTVKQTFDTVLSTNNDNKRFSNARKPTFTFAGSPAGSYTYKCQPGRLAEWVTCASPYTPTFTASANGLVFKVKAINSQGEEDLIPASSVIYVDLEAPNTAFAAGGPAEGSTQYAAGSTTTATFNFDAPGELSPSVCADDEPANCATYECKLDTATTWTPCPTPYTTPALGAGPHSLSVRAVDASGNPSASPKVRNWTVSVPHLTVVEQSSSGTSLSSASEFGAPLDWIHWWSPNSPFYDHMNVPQRISTFSAVGATGTGGTGTVTGPTTWTWTDAAGATPSGSSASGVARKELDGRGVAFTVPTTTNEERLLRVHTGVRGAGTVAQLTVSFNGGAPQSQTITATGNSATAILNKSYTVRFRPTAANDTLRVEWKILSGGANTGAAAILFASSLH